jgi:hypothetical protein
MHPIGNGQEADLFMPQCNHRINVQKHESPEWHSPMIGWIAHLS